MFSVLPRWSAAVDANKHHFKIRFKQRNLQKLQKTQLHSSHLSMYAHSENDDKRDGSVSDGPCSSHIVMGRVYETNNWFKKKQIQSMDKHKAQNILLIDELR